MMPHYKTVIESIGTYLPPLEVTTEEVIKGCAGIARAVGAVDGHSSRSHGESEFAVDLAEKAIRDCLSRSAFRARRSK